MITTDVHSEEIGIEEASKILGCSKSRVFEMLRYDLLKSFKDGKMRKFYRSDVIAYRDAREQIAREQGEAMAAIARKYSRVA